MKCLKDKLYLQVRRQFGARTRIEPNWLVWQRSYMRIYGQVNMQVNREVKRRVVEALYENI